MNVVSCVCRVGCQSSHLYLHSLLLAFLLYVRLSSSVCIRFCDHRPFQPGKNPNRTRLDILIENKGRCSGEVKDLGCAPKVSCSLVSVSSQPSQDIFAGANSVTLNDTALKVSNFTMTKLPVLSNIAGDFLPFQPFSQSFDVPSFYRGYLTITDASPKHTWLNFIGFGHGFVMINAFNIGRFSSWGPAHTLYVPASVLRQGKNEVS